MPFPRRPLARARWCAAAVALAAAAFGAVADDASDRRVLQRPAIDAGVEKRLLALDAERISERDVREVLARASAPRIINLEGSLPVVTMTSFAEFLVAMGY